MSIENKTIAALATAPQSSGVAVIRISGQNSVNILKKVFKSNGNLTKFPRKMILGRFFDPNEGAVLDQCLAVYFPAHSSYTGEEQVELHAHGSTILTTKILRLLYENGASPAQPGEFTQRAFENGKLDLIQAEAVGDLIAATSERALRVAAENLEGKLSSVLNEIGEPLRDILAEIEAGIDFPEEEIEPEHIKSFIKKLNKINTNLKTILNSYDYGQVVKEGYRVLICGKPNAGKSSLLNQLLQSDRAIVTSVSGTTRDLIEENAIIDGYKFVFCDTAGITETSDEVEKIGVELALEKIEWADLVLLVADATEEEKAWKNLLTHLQKSKVWLLVNKIDINPDSIGKIHCSSCARNIYISALDGSGLDGLRSALKEEVINTLHDKGEANAIITNERQRNCLFEAVKRIQDSIEVIRDKKPSEIISIELRSALKTLEELVGVTYTEDILGRIFSKFCIGK